MRHDGAVQLPIEEEVRVRPSWSSVLASAGFALLICAGYVALHWESYASGSADWENYVLPLALVIAAFVGLDLNARTLRVRATGLDLRTGLGRMLQHYGPEQIVRFRVDSANASPDTRQWVELFFEDGSAFEGIRCDASTQGKLVELLRAAIPERESDLPFPDELDAAGARGFPVPDDSNFAWTLIIGIIGGTLLMKMLPDGEGWPVPLLIVKAWVPLLFIIASVWVARKLRSRFWVRGDSIELRSVFFIPGAAIPAGKLRGYRSNWQPKRSKYFDTEFRIHLAEGRTLKLGCVRKNAGYLEAWLKKHVGEPEPHAT